MRVFDEAGLGFTVVPSEGGMVWTIRDPSGNTAMEFRSGSAASGDRPPEDGDQCVNLRSLWADPEFRRQLDSGLVDSYGRPVDPEGRDFFSEHHRDHEH
jgi:hypothetical protein